jgi:hypothetical protein
MPVRNLQGDKASSIRILRGSYAGEGGVNASLAPTGSRITWTDQEGRAHRGVIKEPPFPYPPHYAMAKARYFEADDGRWFWIRRTERVEVVP